VAVATIRNALHDCRPVTIELLNYRKDGSVFWNELSISPVWDGESKLTNFVATMTDVTKRRQLEEQYRQAQKLEAIGQLAGGIAHDFNNLLTVITCYSDMLMTTTDPDELAHEQLAEIKKAGERAAALTRQLLLFSRKEVQSPKVLDLNEIVQRTEKLLARVIGEDIHLITDLDPQLGHIKADAGQLEQVLLNLTVNARDAMPKGGQLIIETRNAELDEDQVASKEGIQPGSYVSLTVTDSGDGIPPAIREHIFEPFFTTKESGKGTGLGLPVVHSVVKQSGGHIEVVSEPGRGACFKTYFPRIHDEKSAHNPSPAVEATSAGDEIILLVEDEEAVRGLGRRILSACGYNVLEASNIDEALVVSATSHAPIDLLVTDVVLPGMSGREVAELLQVSFPQMKVLYVSGYMDDAVVRHGISHESTAFLQKPYSQTTLTQKVREVLDGNSSS
jgi:signal transduction histidine kinase/CheY-like chemotaxis protein